MNEIIRNEKGFPLDSNGEIDWDLTTKEKNEFMKKWEKQNTGKSSKKRLLTNYTPPKKKRKK